MAMQVTNTEGTDFERIADGVYDVTLDAYEDAGVNPNHLDWGPGVKLIWQLPDGRDKWQTVSQKLGIKATLRGIVEALGGQVEVGAYYELDDIMRPLLGRPAQMFLKTALDGKQKVEIIAAKQRPAPVVLSAAGAPAAEGSIGDCFICRKPGSRYDGEGRIVCEAHASIK